MRLRRSSGEAEPSPSPDDDKGDDKGDAEGDDNDDEAEECPEGGGPSCGSHHHPTKSTPPSSFPPTRLSAIDSPRRRTSIERSSNAVPRCTVDPTPRAHVRVSVRWVEQGLCDWDARKGVVHPVDKGG
jgi:hypothetical protein